MKRLLTAAVLVLLAVPAFAQDDFILTNAEIDALLGGGDGRGRGGRGGNNFVPDPAAMYNQLKDLLKANKVGLDKSQEKPLQNLLDTEAKAIQAFIDEQFGNRGQDNRGGRGNNNAITQIETVVTKHNAELLTQMKADLTPDQLALVTKAEKDKKCLVMLDVINFNFGNRGRGNFDNNLPDRPRCTQQSSTTQERVAVLGEILSKGKKPLTPEQTTKFAALVEARIPLMEEDMRAEGLPIDQLFNQNRNNNNNNNQNNPQQLTNNIVNTIMSQLGVPNNNNNNQNRGRGGNNANFNRGGNNAGGDATNFNRGGGNNPGAEAGNFNRGGGNNPGAEAGNFNRGGGQQQGRGGRGGNNNFNPQQEVQRRTDAILDKVIASLKPEQQPVVKKFKYDMIKDRGFVERIGAILEEEGTPLTEQQATQVQALYNSQNQAIRNFAQQLVQTEVQALPESAFQPPPQQNQNSFQNQNQGRNNNNNNQNNVNQNPAAQQIVSKVLPQVSVRKALLEKATIDAVLKILTPPQVASYKLSTL